jgi:hypothetical protein
MIRKYNYTKRIKLHKNQVSINLNFNNKIKEFEAQFDFKDLSLPDNSKIFIEPYYKTNYMRFDFGTIKEPTSPSNTTLYNFPGLDQISFRVKIVDVSKTRGRILAVINGIEPSNIEEQPADKQSILIVRYVDLGQKLFNLDIDEAETFPLLEINSKIKSATEIIRKDVFISTIYPSVIRQIASEIVNDKTNWDISDEVWQGYWLKYFKKVIGVTIERPISEDDLSIKKEWIDEIVNSFCNHKKVRNRFNSINYN